MKFQQLYEEVLKQLEEALGVPQNVVKQSERIYQELLKLSEQSEEDSKVLQKTFENFNITLGEMVYKDLTLKIFFEHFPNSSLSLKKFVSPLQTHLDVPKMVLKNLTNYDDLLIEVYVNFSENAQKLDLQKLFLNEKEQVISSICHELHHSFSFSKQENLRTKQMIDYKIVTQIDIQIPIIREFFDNLYFTSAFESLVKSSEMYYSIVHKKIKKKDFIKFLDQDETYKRLKQIENLEPSKFLNSLEENIEHVEQFLKNHGENLQDFSTNSQKIEKCLQIVLKLVFEKHYHYFEEYLKNALQTVLNAFSKEFLDGDYSQLEKYVKEVLKDYQKFSKNEKVVDYFLERISEMKEKASEIKKKLAKLYDLCLDEGIREEI